MLEIDILLNLFIKDCMFTTSTIENSKKAPLQNLIVVGHTHKFEEGEEEGWLP